MPTAGAFLVTPGSGGDRHHRAMLALEDGLKIPVERIEFPNRIAGKRAPDRPPVAVEHIRREAARVVEENRIRANRLVLGGRSFGGRMCSMAVAEGVKAAGLVLLSYPLHPPGRPERLRVDHFGALDLPCLFVSGRRDPFGSPEEFRRETERIPGPVDFVWLEGSHDPRGQDAELVAEVGGWLEHVR